MMFPGIVECLFKEAGRNRGRGAVHRFVVDVNAQREVLTAVTAGHGNFGNDQIPFSRHNYDRDRGAGRGSRIDQVRNKTILFMDPGDSIDCGRALLHLSKVHNLLARIGGFLNNLEDRVISPGSLSVTELHAVMLRTTALG